MSEITERHKDTAEAIALYLYNSEEFWGQFSRGFQVKHGSIDKNWWIDLFTSFIAAKLTDLDLPPQTSGYVQTEDSLKKPLPEGTLTVGSHDAPPQESELWCTLCQSDPCNCPPNAIEILKMSKEQRDEEMRKSAEAMKGVDVESFDDYREIGVAWTERTQELCDKMRSTTPPPELEDAVTDALLEIGVASKPNCKVLVAAVTPFCWKPDDQPELGVAWKGVVLEIIKAMYESNDPIAQGQAIGEIVFTAVQPLFDNLNKQVEYQREIHLSNDAAFEKINNEALAKIETLQKQYDTMLHDDAYQIKLLQDDNETLKRLLNEAIDE